MSNIKSKVIKVLYCIYLVLLVCFIFSNSLSSVEESSEQSTAVLDTVNEIVESVGIPFRFEHVFIRKSAHVIEFMALGASLFGFLILDKKINAKNCIYISFASCVIAITDETIQFFSERGSMLLDVWLDFVSAVLGITIVYLIYYASCKKKSKKNK